MVCRTPHGNHPGTPSIGFSANIQYWTWILELEQNWFPLKLSYSFAVILNTLNSWKFPLTRIIIPFRSFWFLNLQSLRSVLSAAVSESSKRQKINTVESPLTATSLERPLFYCPGGQSTPLTLVYTSLQRQPPLKRFPNCQNNLSTTASFFSWLMKKPRMVMKFDPYGTLMINHANCISIVFHLYSRILLQ